MFKLRAAQFEESVHELANLVYGGHMAKGNEVKKGQAPDELPSQTNVVSNVGLESRRQKKREKIFSLNDVDQLFDKEIDSETLSVQDEIAKIGAEVRTARRAAGLSQAELAKEANVARSTVASVEGGYVVGGAQYGTIVRLLNACGKKMNITIEGNNRNIHKNRDIKIVK
jgi:DNA-binding XRE family transcriptional regulator